MSYVRTTTASRREERNDNRRYLHVSCNAYMVPDPKGQTLPMIPYIGPGTTYAVGRNRDKRQRRAAGVADLGKFVTNAKPA